MITSWTKDSLREFEHKLAEDFKKGKINCPLHLCGGNEDALIEIFTDVQPEDYVFSSHRNHYHYLLKAGDPSLLLDEIYGLPSGVNGGKARSMNVINPTINFYSSAIVAGSCAIACGVALAIKKRKGGNKVWCFIGDGAEDSGHFIESVRFANARSLPLTFIIEDNDFSIESTKADRWHNYSPIESVNILRYKYERVYPHVGVGEWITF